MITLTAEITKDDGSKIVLNYRNSLSIERSIFDRADITMPSWGVISNSGKLSFVDTDGSIRQLAEQRLLKSGMAVTLSLGNTLKNSTAPVGNFLTEDWSYDNDDHRVSVTLKDELVKWQNLEIKGLEYDITQNDLTAAYMTAKDVYNYLREQSVALGFASVAEFLELDENTKSYLQNYLIK